MREALRARARARSAPVYFGRNLITPRGVTRPRQVDIKRGVLLRELGLRGGVALSPA